MNGLNAAEQTNTQFSGRRYTTGKSHVFTQIFLTVIGTCLSTTFLPALSQGVSTAVVRIETKQQVINQRQFGWERPLTEKDPNLSHWHWEPITNSVRKIQTRAIYSKPVRAVGFNALKTPMPQIAKSNESEDLSGKLRNNRNPEISANGRIVRLPLSPPVVATYDSTFHTEPELVNERRSQTSLAGKILKKRTNDI